MSFFGDLFGKEKTETKTTNDYRKAPEYAEAEGARGKWWETLQSWAGQPGYGAIAPNWGDIWTNARNKLSRQYWGGPEGPGAVAKVKASAARRGVSDSPALQTTIGRMGMQEGNQLMDMAIQQAIAEANLGESGRKTWLSSVQNLASQKPQMLNYGSTSTKETGGGEGWEILAALGGMAASGMGAGGGASFGAAGAGGAGGIMDLVAPDFYSQGLMGAMGGMDPYGVSGGVSGLGAIDDEDNWVDSIFGQADDHRKAWPSSGGSYGR